MNIDVERRFSFECTFSFLSDDITNIYFQVNICKTYLQEVFYIRQARVAGEAHLRQSGLLSIMNLPITSKHVTGFSHRTGGYARERQRLEYRGAGATEQPPQFCISVHMPSRREWQDDSPVCTGRGMQRMRCGVGRLISYQYSDSADILVTVGMCGLCRVPREDRLRGGGPVSTTRRPGVTLWCEYAFRTAQTKTNEGSRERRAVPCVVRDEAKSTSCVLMTPGNSSRAPSSSCGQRAFPLSTVHARTTRE